MHQLLFLFFMSYGIAKPCENKVVEIDGIKYKLTKL